MNARDQPIRDQAIQALDQSIALAAGAGSGKTTVLTQRILELLIRGTPAARIAAISFTEKSATELQARVRDTLERRLASHGDAARAALLAELPRLTLSTIHGFCRHLLTVEAFAAGWAPDTELLPDIVEDAQVQEAFRSWNAGFRMRHGPASLVIHQLVPARTLREGAMRMLSYRDLDPVRSALPFDPTAACAALAPIYGAIYQASRRCTAPQHDKLYRGAQGLLTMLHDVAMRSNTEAVVRILASGVGVKLGLSLGRKSDWPGHSKAEFVSALNQFQAWRAERIETLHGVLVRDLAHHFVQIVEDAKARAAVADYDDLLVRAAALLREQPETRRRLAARFDALLIDEVQDTDPIQAEVAALLTRDPERGGEWDAHPPLRGRLFAVGDARQSIYRFRRADEYTWAQLQHLLTRDGQALRLSENFRSVPGIVEWVNATFARLPGYEAQRAHREQAKLDPVVRLPIHPDAGEPGELDAIVRYLLKLRREGLVADPKSAQARLRPLEWSDVMLLLPSWSKGEILQATLTRAGIPCVVEGGAMFMARDEVRLAIAALKCLEDPSDEQSTVLALRGLFALSWDELARHRAAGGAWRYTIPDPPAGPVAAAFALLRRLARQRGRRSWTALLDELLELSGASAIWAASRDAEARLANLDKLRELLRQLAARARSPAEVLRRLDERGARGQEQDLARVDASAPAVRVTSYFKAKGLEAPVVVLCFATRKSDEVKATVDRRARQVTVKFGALRPVDWGAREALEKQASSNERQRWMYVAATRARDQLVIVDHPSSKLIREHLANGLALATTIEPGSLPAPDSRDDTFAGLDPLVDRWLAEPASAGSAEPDPSGPWLAQLRQSIASARDASTTWTSVHQLANAERVSGARSPVGVRGGDLVHQIMQSLDFKATRDQQIRGVEALARTHARALGIGRERARLCVEIVHRMLENPVLDQARAAPQHWVEVPFTCRDQSNERMVSGRIDLAFPRDASLERWVVVDWKSDLPARDTPAWRNYQSQLEHYAKAVLQIVPSCKACTAVLVGPHPELAAAPTVIEALAERLPALAEGLDGLLERGLPPPGIGAELGPGIPVDLSWAEQQIALCVDRSAEQIAALRSLGWGVIVVESTTPGWVEQTLEAITAGFALPEISEE